MTDYIRDYGQDQELVKQFFRDFSERYAEKLTRIANREDIHLVVDVADLERFNQDLANQVTSNTMRYCQIFNDALDEVLPSYKTKEIDEKDVMDIFIEQRLFIAERNKRGQASNTTTSASQSFAPRSNIIDIDGTYPPDLIRRFEVTFKPSHSIATPIRDVKAPEIGKLITVRGIVIRVTDVKPKITIVCYTCDQCGAETFQPVKGTDFTPLYECSSATCKANKALGRIMMQTRGSKFVKFQEIRLQEHADQVPTGHIPRTMNIYVHGELTRLCAPGDHISVAGVFLTIEKSGFRMRTAGLAADTYLEAHHITRMNKTADDELSDDPMTEEDAKALIEGDSSFLERLSKSIAPEIYGHDDLKKALLLLLVGGVDKNPHGMKIRGNINICLMGDPGVAKSQLLSFIDRLSTRSQYTTGRGSSGVGLTAAVLRDPITQELALEGGALVLADGGVCCIDEFDKMMDADRTAIHEVMEQQTVSIAKAGIMTTLNARVSILAAANPAYGRYNQARSIEDNLQLPPALLSRFDLLWLIKDSPEKTSDLNLAQHVTYIHSNPNEDVLIDYDAIDMKTMRKYISLCKSKTPHVPENLTNKLVDIYCRIRQKKRMGLIGETLFTSPRSLLAIIRLSTAFARLRLADAVEEIDVAAAFRLYESSRESIEKKHDTNSSVTSEVSNLIRELHRQLESTGEETLTKARVIEAALEQDMDLRSVEKALENLASDRLGVIDITENGDIIYLGAV